MALAFLRAVLCAVAVTVMSSGAVAQIKAPDTTREQNAPEHFDSQAQPRRNETLTERLDRTDGVIKPPAHVDPEIHEQPPATGDRGIVIPPPDTKGGGNSIKPK